MKRIIQMVLKKGYEDALSLIRNSFYIGYGVISEEITLRIKRQLLNITHLY
ncbi:hypothetical protein RhiirA5_434485 [Rhizophagus irregularis]|uniref:Uncharacterized protein n=1 Tax=Rhizophagus irregularis TaxID=588596 RepID=A0A2I1FIX7_9GLOM|nr:hypothetical protein RhiirA5_434485 [Rhizophagus irregularis]PKC54259.1 hypothetical protein RhiirA1_477679 [Rhizophagus irregularis]PKY34330.1 hypothetical protein RhiirB3_453945 [Rhizophagus irregularis]